MPAPMHLDSMRQLWHWTIRISATSCGTSLPAAGRFCCRACQKLRGIRCNHPTGAFYAFPDISSFGLSSTEFCNRLLDEVGVVCIPGSAFGACGEGFIRICYTCGEEDLREALARIRRFCDGLRKA